MTRPPTSAGSRVWVHRSTSPIILGLVPLIVGAQLRRRQPVGPTIARVSLGVLAVVSTGSVRVVAGRDGLTVGLGPWGWPVRRYPMARIRSVRLEPRSALRYVGLGYRLGPNGTRIVLGIGDVLVVELVNGRTFGVTIPDAARAVSILEKARVRGSSILGPDLAEEESDRFGGDDET